MDKKEFSSYEEARLAYNIPDDDIYLKITNHEKSLNRILQCRNVIHYIGEGYKKYPGYPSGNQMYYRQLPLLKKLKYDYYVHAFNKIGDKLIKILYLSKLPLMQNSYLSKII